MRIYPKVDIRTRRKVTLCIFSIIFYTITQGLLLGSLGGAIVTMKNLTFSIDSSSGQNQIPLFQIHEDAVLTLENVKIEAFSTNT